MKNLMERFSPLAALLSMILATTVRGEGSKQPVFPDTEGFGKYAKGGGLAS